MAAKKKKLEPPSEGAVDAIEFLEGLRGGPMTFGEVLAETRRVDGASLAVFAAKLGISRAALCDIEKGRKGVSPERAARWAKALHMSKERAVALALQSQLDEAGLKLRVVVHAA
jgi:transcriptional regulator with XRE-family HTH domain